MPTTLDCELLRDLFGSEEVRECFDSRALLQGWLHAEKALVEALADCGLIPWGAADAIGAECDASRFDLAELRHGIAVSQHPLVPMVRVLGERCGEHGVWVHWGATTQDIIDTGLVLQTRRALDPIERDLNRLLSAARSLALEHADLPMAGRTHAQHAVPITFGLKAASWADELARCVERLDAARDAALTAQLGGAAGTLASLGSNAESVSTAFARRLGLAEPGMAWHAARDRLRDLAHALDEIAAASGRIAAEIVRLQATEVAEASEPSSPDHVGSSTMPQKRNPMSSEYVVASCRLLQASAHSLQAASGHAGERDMGLWAVEWIAVPQMLILAGGILEKLTPIVERLDVDDARMRRNLDLTEGRIMAEAVMMALAIHTGHEQAHATVANAARESAETGRSFGEVLETDPDVTAHLATSELRALLDPNSYLGTAGSTARRAGRTD